MAIRARVATLLREQRVDEAEAIALSEARQAPSVDACLAWADVLKARGQRERALHALRDAAPRFAAPDLWIAAAGVASELSDRVARDEALSEARSRFPTAPYVWAALSDAVEEDGDRDASLDHARRAAELAPDDAELAQRLARRLVLVGRATEAAELFFRAAKRTPDDAALASACLMIRHYVVPAPATEPAVAHAQLAELAADHARWGARFGQALSVLSNADVSRAPRRLRIGYLSPDFFLHAVMRFLLPILETHDRSAFEVFCYGSVSEPDATTATVRALDLTYRDIHALSDREAAQRIADDRIDILVELAGHTSGSRLRVTAFRPAPIQLSYLGYPNSTGVEAIDFRLSDALADPPGVDPWSQEAVLRLPHTAWTFDPLATGQPARRPAGAPIVFGAFHNMAKVTDTMIGVWRAILERCPDARLALPVRRAGARAAQALRDRFSALGIASDRLELLPPVSLAQHMARFDAIDVCLDTTPYAGTTTTCEALWMGVPVVSYAGCNHAGRVGVSLLGALGLSDLVAQTLDDYVEIAVALANDRERRLKLRATLRELMQRSPLGDRGAFTRSLEQIYQKLHHELMASAAGVARASGRCRVVEVARVGRLAIPGELAQPDAYRAVEQRSLDDGEGAFVASWPRAGGVAADVFPGLGEHTVALARAHAAPTFAFCADHAELLALSLRLNGGLEERVQLSTVVPGASRGRVQLGGGEAEVASLRELLPDGAKLDVLRLGLPGCELDVLTGADGLLVAPNLLVVMRRQFEPLPPELAQALAALGLGLFRYAPALESLIETDWQTRAGYLMAARAASVAAARASAVSFADRARAVRTWSPQQATLPASMSAWLAACDHQRPMSERAASIERACEAIMGELAAAPDDPFKRLTAARIWLDAGQPLHAAEALEPLVGLVMAGTVSFEPRAADVFLPALASYDPNESDERTADWVAAQVLEGFVCASAPTSFFHPPAVLALLRRVAELGFASVSTLRRAGLLEALSDARAGAGSGLQDGGNVG